jgi:hypothetical protein
VRYSTTQTALSEDAYVMAESPTTNYGTKLRPERAFDA